MRVRLTATRSGRWKTTHAERSDLDWLASAQSSIEGSVRQNYGRPYRARLLRLYGRVIQATAELITPFIGGRRVRFISRSDYSEVERRSVDNKGMLLDLYWS